MIGSRSGHTPPLGPISGQPLDGNTCSPARQSCSTARTANAQLYAAMHRNWIFFLSLSLSLATCNLTFISLSGKRSKKKLFLKLWIIFLGCLLAGKVSPTHCHYLIHILECIECIQIRSQDTQKKIIIFNSTLWAHNKSEHLERDEKTRIECRHSTLSLAQSIHSNHSKHSHSATLSNQREKWRHFFLFAANLLVFERRQ